MSNLIENVNSLSEHYESIYAVNPKIFAFLWLMSIPFLWLSVFMTAKVAIKKRAGIRIWAFSLLFWSVLPYLYIVIFGRGLSAGFQVFLYIVILLTVVFTINKRM